MAIEIRAAVERAARELLRAVAELPPHEGGVRVAEVEGLVGCLIQVWRTSRPMPTLRGEQPASGGRAECRADILEVVRAAGQARTLKEVIRALKDAGKGHGPGTVAKALAELTRSGELINPRDKRGYRLAGWRKDKTPSLFD